MDIYGFTNEKVRITKSKLNFTQPKGAKKRKTDTTNAIWVAMVMVSILFSFQLTTFNDVNAKRNIQKKGKIVLWIFTHLFCI